MSFLETVEKVYNNKYHQDLRERLTYLKNEYGESNGDLVWEWGDKDDMLNLCEMYGIE